jgi:hypothetical protein
MHAGLLLVELKSFFLGDVANLRRVEAAILPTTAALSPSARGATRLWRLGI